MPERLTDEFAAARPSDLRDLNPSTKETEMGKLIVTEFMSLDGVMEAPGGEETHPNTAWCVDSQ